MSKEQMIEIIINMSLSGIRKEELEKMSDKKLFQLIFLNSNLSNNKKTIKSSMISAIMYIQDENIDPVILWGLDLETLKKIYLSVRRITEKQFDKLVGYTIDDFKEKAINNTDDEYIAMDEEEVIIASGVINANLKEQEYSKEEFFQNRPLHFGMYNYLLNIKFSDIICKVDYAINEIIKLKNELKNSYLTNTKIEKIKNQIKIQDNYLTTYLFALTDYLKRTHEYDKSLEAHRLTLPNAVDVMLEINEINTQINALEKRLEFERANFRFAENGFERSESETDMIDLQHKIDALKEKKNKIISDNGLGSGTSRH